MEISKLNNMYTQIDIKRLFNSIVTNRFTCIYHMRLYLTHYINPCSWVECLHPNLMTVICSGIRGCTVFLLIRLMWSVVDRIRTVQGITTRLYTKLNLSSHKMTVLTCVIRVRTSRVTPTGWG